MPKFYSSARAASLEEEVKRYRKTDVQSIDIDEARGPDIVMSVTDLSYADESFDEIYALEVLEHVKEPRQAVDEVYRCLKKGGTFVCSPLLSSAFTTSRTTTIDIQSTGFSTC